jgi:hypothetical protein
MCNAARNCWSSIAARGRQRAAGREPARGPQLPPDVLGVYVYLPLGVIFCRICREQQMSSPSSIDKDFRELPMLSNYEAFKNTVAS